MVIVPALTTDGRDAVFIGLSASDVAELQKRSTADNTPFAVIDFKQMPLSNGKGAEKVIIVFGETDEDCKLRITNQGKKHASGVYHDKKVH